MLSKLKDAEIKYEQILADLTDPDVASDIEKYKKLTKEHKAMTPLVEKYREYISYTKMKDDAEALMSDPEMKELAEIEFLEAKENRVVTWEVTGASKDDIK